MSRREQIRMSEAERASFLAAGRTIICATSGVRGWPHLMPLWYTLRGDDVWAWTYARSQKVRNLERDPRATLQLEDGEQYAELRGVMIEAETVIHRELASVTEFALELFNRYGTGTGGGGTENTDALREAARAQASKRVALQFRPQRIVTWDHRKLGGLY